MWGLLERVEGAQVTTELLNQQTITVYPLTHSTFLHKWGRSHLINLEMILM
jgi:hypothetical protein